jgi:hypothetical protein
MVGAFLFFLGGLFGPAFIDEASLEQLFL